MLGPLTYLDAFLIAICFISGLLAMYRGLSREVLSILSWAVAGAATAYFVLFQKKMAEDIAQQIGGSPVLVVQLGVGALIFVIVLLIVHLFTTRISDAILDSRIGLIDRIGGFAFGVIRGFIIVLVLFMGYHKFFPEKDQSPIVMKAVSRPLLLTAGRALEPPLEYIYNKYLNKPPAADAQPKAG